MSGTVDMHLHTRASDGDWEPEDLVARCDAAGLRTIAVTDHNSMRHVERAAAACAARGMDLVPACEISTRWREREHHLLAYFVDAADTRFRERIERVRRADLDRSRRWVANAAAAGLPITWARIEEVAGPDRVPPFAVIAALLRESAPDDPRVAPHRDGGPGALYQALFATGRALETERPWQPDLLEAIAWVREAGGVAVLAHPGVTLRDIDPEEALALLAAGGLHGVEAWTTWHSAEQGERFDTLGRAAGLAVTAGSDYHGPTAKPRVTSPGQVTHNGDEVVEGLRRLR